MRFFKLAVLFAIVLSGSVSVAGEVKEWDIENLKIQAGKQGWTFDVKESWVTDHLKKGGSLKDITGLVTPLGAQLRGVWDNIEVRSDLPAQYDWRQHSEAGLQPIRNQKSCGSCWAFSVTAVLEALLKIQDPTFDPDLAEQTLVSSCSRSGSCSGGYFSAFDYLKNPGMPVEEQDPYRASNSSCRSGLNPVAAISRWAYIGNNGSSATVDQIKTAVLTYGPVSVSVNGSFGSYSSGIYNRCNTSGTNHMVNIEGWNDEGEYWIMRNSWGANWGEEGYMRIKWKGRNGYRCNNIGRTAAYAVLNPEYVEELRKAKARY